MMIQNLFFEALKKIDRGCLEVVTPDKKKTELGNADSELKANLIIKDWSLFDLKDLCTTI